MNNLHPPSAQDIGGADHQRVTDLAGQCQRFFEVMGHSRFGHWDPQFLHHQAETVTVLRQIDDIRRGTQDAYSGLCQFAGDIQRGLPAELDNDPFRLLPFTNAKNFFNGERFKI